MKKTSSITILALLALSAFMILVPLAANATITGTPVLTGVSSLANPTHYHAATDNLTVPAGTSIVSNIDGTATTGTDNVLSINFTGVTFSAASFWLYMSENGQGNVNPALGDILYAGPFAASATGTHTVTGVMTEYHNFIDHFTGLNETFYAGRGGLTGPIPLEINSSYTYIKVYDGSCGAPGTFTSCAGTGVAEAKQLILVQPGIVVNPTSGDAGTPVTIYGGGFTSGDVVNITYSFHYTSWDDALSTVVGTLTGPITVPKDGIFKQAATMVDTKQPYNLKTVAGTYPSLPITLTAYKSDTHTIYNSVQNTAAPVIFTEWSRVFDQVSSYANGVKTPFEIDGFGTYGNDTGHQNDLAPYGTTTTPLEVYVMGSIGIVGDYTFHGATVNVTVTGHTGSIGTKVSNSSGYYSINVTVPVLTIGAHTVTVRDDGVSYQFTIDVLPTLLITPYSGPTSGCNGSLGTCPTGGTTVTVTAYGFPATNIVWIYWGSILYEDGFYYNVVNASTSSTGTLTHPVTFAVPSPTWGGYHDVYAVVNSTEAYPGSKTDDIGTYESYVAFLVTPTIVATPSTVNANTMSPVNSESSGFINVSVEGLEPAQSYMIQIDHSLYSYITACQNPYYGCYGEDGYYLYNGDAQFNFTAAGFLPGVHQIEITPFTGSECGDQSYGCLVYYGVNYSTPAAWTYFNVTTKGDYISNEIGGIASSVTNAVNTALASFSTQLNSIQASLTTITGDVSGLSGQLNTITGDVSGLGSQLTTITNTVNSISSTVGTIQTGVSGLVTSVGTLQTDVSSIMTTVTGINTAVGGISGIGTQATNIMNAVNTEQTYVLVVAVLAAIILVLVLAVLIRKLS